MQASFLAFVTFCKEFQTVYKNLRCLRFLLCLPSDLIRKIRALPAVARTRRWVIRGPLHRLTLQRFNGLTIFTTFRVTSRRIFSSTSVKARKGF